MSTIKKGDKVEILIGAGDTARYGMTREMEEAKGVIAEVLFSVRDVVRVRLPGHLFEPSYHTSEVKKVETTVKLRGFTADTVIVDDPAAEHIQSHDELVAENESLEKQIRKLEARVERKKEFQRQNVRKIAAWQVILEK